MDWICMCHLKAQGSEVIKKCTEPDAANDCMFHVRLVECSGPLFTTLGNLLELHLDKEGCFNHGTYHTLEDAFGLLAKVRGK